MRKMLRGMLMLGVLAAFALPASAQVSLTLTSARPYGTVIAWGAYVGPYRAMVNEPGYPTIDVFCVDYNNHISVGDTWNTNFRLLSGDLTGTRFGAAAHQKYVQNAWLASQFSTQPTTMWGKIHAAIWQTMTCPTCMPSSSVGDPVVAYWRTESEKASNYNTVNLAEWSVVTDVNTVNGYGGKQEYLTRTVVPEPGTLLLFGTGVVLLGLVGWRRTLA